MRIILLFITLLFSQQSIANTLKLDYSVFFGYMKTLYKLDYEDVTSAFYLLDPASGEHCTIVSAEMVVDNKREKIDFQTQGRLLPFFSEQHRKDGANIEVNSVNEHCALQITPMVKESKLSQLTAGKLLSMSAQLEGVLRKNAGMIGRYFLPTYQGVRFKLVTPLTQSDPLADGMQLASNGDLLISNQLLASLPADQRIDYQVSRITPWMIK